MIYDPSTTYDAIANDIPAVAFADYWGGLFPFNDTFSAYLHEASAACGYDDFMAKYLTFPPPGPFPPPEELPGMSQNGGTADECSLWNAVYDEIFSINPCFDVYQVATTCPVLWDVLGFPGSFDYLPEGASIYFNRTDVQKAINAPLGEWSECAENPPVFVDRDDNSPPSGVSVLPGVIERSKRTVIGHGVSFPISTLKRDINRSKQALDMVLISNGTLMMIQNMTWNGAQGFQSKPTDAFYIPYHNEDPSESTLAGSGVFGTTHTERGLTWVSVDLSGHMIPQYAPSAAYRHLEFLLGRIDSLSSTVPFTTDPYPQPNVTLGNGTAPPVKRWY
jgi:carboxypeptidase D